MIAASPAMGLDTIYVLVVTLSATSAGAQERL